MKIFEIAVCLDCEEVNPAEAVCCSACSSRSLFLVTRWIPPKDQAKDTIGKTENIKAEILKLRSRIEEMLADVDDGPEPVGICV